MTGIINTFPPVTELPPGSASGPANLPPVTYQYAVLSLPQTWTGVQTFAFGMFQFAGSISGVTALRPQAVAGGILSIPNGPDTLVGLASTGTFTNKTWNGATIAVAFGGTGATTLTAHGVLLGEGTGSVVATAAMTDGQLLVGQTGADPLPKTLSGDATLSAAGALTIAPNVVNFSKVQQVGASQLIGNPTGALASLSGITLGSTLAFAAGALQTAALTGDVTAAANSFATTITNNAVTNAKAAQMAANTIKGNNTGGTANASDLSVAQTVTLLAASEATAEAGTSTATLNTPQGTAQAIVAIDQKFKNIVGRNGGLEVWQRGTPVNVAASTIAYTVDGWYLATGASQAHTITQVAGLTSGSVFAARVQRNNGQTGVGAIVFAFPLDTDELAKMRGNTVALSFSVATGANWSPASGTLTWKLYCGTGAVAKRNATPYTGETNPISSSSGLAVSSSARPASISSSIASNITQAELQFTWTPSGTAGVNDWISFDDIQIEVVPAGIAGVTPLFERSDYIWDQTRCLRFLPRINSPVSNGPVAIGSCASTTIASMITLFNVPARVTPTGITVSNVTDFAVSSGGVDTVCTNVTFTSRTTPYSCLLNYTVAAGLTSGAASYAIAPTVGAFILFTGAEI